MNIKNFILSYYKNSLENFHIHKVEHSFEARKPHTHNYFQIYYISGGSLVHFVENGSSRLVHGDMFIIPPGVTHYISPEKNTIFYSLSFMPDFIDKTSRQSRLATNFLRNMQSGDAENVRPKLSIDTNEMFYIEGIMEHILYEFNQKPLGYDETIHAYTILLLNFIARNYFEKSKNNLTGHFEDNRQFVLHCIEYIKNNFADEISLEEISKRSTMSKSSFCELFNKITGQSFNKYLNVCRIKRATELINKGYKITAIYGLCGYNDFSTFYRNFKKIMGLSPQSYKNTQKKEDLV